jgi:hypothetical protein
MSLNDDDDDDDDGGGGGGGGGDDDDGVEILYLLKADFGVWELVNLSPIELLV